MAKTAAALHILVKEEALAKEILAKLAKGGNFQELAKKHSTCPSGRKGAIWASSGRDRWCRPLIKRSLPARC
ncbi:Chaperone surA precursor [Pantoea vagans C9-1]|nr:Chaperone surA precursor [Pantoea vagans C9-1]